MIHAYVHTYMIHACMHAYIHTQRVLGSVKRSRVCQPTQLHQKITASHTIDAKDTQTQTDTQRHTRTQTRARTHTHTHTQAEMKED